MRNDLRTETVSGDLRVHLTAEDLAPYGLTAETSCGRAEGECWMQFLRSDTYAHLDGYLEEYCGIRGGLTWALVEGVRRAVGLPTPAPIPVRE